MSTQLLIQSAAAVVCLSLLVAWLATHRGKFTARTTMQQLLLWYPLSAPWLLVRTPLLYLFVEHFHLQLWVAVVIEFVIERPLFFLTAREITTRTLRDEK